MTGWLITHDRCLDGATAALIGEAAGFTPVFVDPDRVAEGFLQITDTRPVYLADVSLKQELWSAYKSRVTFLLDHHQSALSLAKEPNVQIDLSRSGAHLLYDFAVLKRWITPTPQWQRLCLAVERYDLWKPRHDDGQDLNRLFHEWGYSWYRSRFAQGFVPFTADEGARLAELIREERTYVARHIQTARRYQGELPFAIYGVVLDQEGPLNVISQTLIEEGAALVVALKPEGKLSARSDNRVNAAQLMEALFHGGGHARAAGGRLRDNDPQDLSALLPAIARHLLQARA